MYVKYVKYNKDRVSEKRYISRWSMHQVGSKRYRLHQCTGYVYTKLALQVTDTQTHKCTVKCTASSWKHSGMVKKQKEPSSQVCVHIKYISCIFVTFDSNRSNVKNPCKISRMCVHIEYSSCMSVRSGSNMSNVKYPGKIGILSKRKRKRKINRLSTIECAKQVNGIIVRLGSNRCNEKSHSKIDSLSKRKCKCKLNGLSNIECAKRVNGEPKESYKTVSGDYENISVLSRMEAKSEDGPEMDVDGTTPDEQNGKKWNVIYCRGYLSACVLCTQSSNVHNDVICMQLTSNHNDVSVKPSSHTEMLARMHIPPHCRRITLNLFGYRYNIAQSLTMF